MSRRLAIVAVTAVFSLLVGVSLLLVERQQQLVEVAGIATAKALADQVSLFRAVYTERVLAPRRATPAFAVDLPIPATLVRHLGERVAQQVPGADLRLYSRYPFPTNAKPQPTLDAFASDAITALERAPTVPFYRLETRRGQRTLRYAVADRMQPHCVACHNGHPQTPKNDWRVGDVRGVLEVVVPVDRIAANLARHDIGFAGLLTLGMLLIGGALLAFWRVEIIQREQRRMAALDPLTGLATRRRGAEELEREVARARRTRRPLSVVMFDIDHFKRINDQFGHATGDKVLRQIGGLIDQAARTTDHRVRWGGEELLVVLPETSLEQARSFAERVRVLVHQRAIEPQVSISAGLAQLGDDEMIDETLARADAALYQAKGAGRNCVHTGPVAPLELRPERRSEGDG